VITAGVDLAAMPERTALASIEWAGTRAVIRDIVCPAGDEVILELIGQAAKTGIDCPLGWPDAFADFVAAHRSGHVALVPDGLGAGWRRPLTMRRTDVFVQERLHLVPLSVSADRIAHVALRCAVLLAKLDAAGWWIAWVRALSLRSTRLPHFWDGACATAAISGPGRLRCSLPSRGISWRQLRGWTAGRMKRRSGVRAMLSTLSSRR
jgi:hypothetical protein